MKRLIIAALVMAASASAMAHVQQGHEIYQCGNHRIEEFQTLDREAHSLTTFVKASTDGVEVYSGDLNKIPGKVIGNNNDFIFQGFDFIEGSKYGEEWYTEDDGATYHKCSVVLNEWSK